MKFYEADATKIKYTNYRNETSVRIIRPIVLWFGSTGYHKEEQWILTAYDCDKRANRVFALKDIIYHNDIMHGESDDKSN